jgi:hypothetical protein
MFLDQEKRAARMIQTILNSKTEPMIDALAKQRGECESKALLMGMNANQ